MLRIFPTNPAQHARPFFYLPLYLWKKERLRTITILFSKKIVIRKKRTITTKNENNETEEKKGNAIVSLLRCIKKYTVLTQKK